ncbi:MAG: HD domain-containing protein [Bacilli bacterium]|nr:HD domain-containing protein [Bacilli bacterium]
MIKKLKEYKDGEHFSGLLLISNSAKCVSNNGKSYYNLELRDSSATIVGKKWDILPEDEKLLVTGNIVDIQGEINLYRGSLQLKVIIVSEPNEPVDPSMFAKQSPVPEEELKKDFRYYYDQIKDPDLIAVVSHIIKKRKDLYFTAPGGISIHHDYTNGLLHHTVSMLHHAEYFANFYPDIDKELLFAGVILHDIDKTQEIEGSLTYKRTLQGNLLGHLSMSAAEVQEAKAILGIDSEKLILLQHMILSHHGLPEYGSPVLPMTKEAILLHYIDNIDCDMNLACKVIDNIEEGEFSEKQFALDGRQLYKPHRK